MSREERQKLREMEQEGSPIAEHVPRVEDFWCKSPTSQKSSFGHDEVEARREEWSSSPVSENGGSSDSKQHKTSSSIVGDPLLSTSPRDYQGADEELWAQDNDRGHNEGMGSNESDAIGVGMHDEIEEEQRALEWGNEYEEGDDKHDHSDLDTRAEELLQKCKSVLEGFYSPDLQKATEVSGRNIHGKRW